MQRNSFSCDLQTFSEILSLIARSSRSRFIPCVACRTTGAFHKRLIIDTLLYFPTHWLPIWNPYGILNTKSPLHSKCNTPTDSNTTSMRHSKSTSLRLQIQRPYGIQIQHPYGFKIDIPTGFKLQHIKRAASKAAL